ncbi:MAG: proton-conducting transporter membrane subunit [Candidatus Gastranaerophilaceae bacterium]|jgi:formate hydrogenlyase subunit 3/multisubunit Na+/H+ antiporter MnhD subunit
MNYFLTGLILIFSGGLISLIFSEKHKAKIVSLFAFLGIILTSIPALNILFNGGILEKIFYLPEPIGKIPLVIDPLTAFFIMLISIMSFLAIVYSAEYLEPYFNKNNSNSISDNTALKAKIGSPQSGIAAHFLFLSILICSMLGVVTIQNALFFLIVWEIMSLSSFFLVIFDSNKKEILSAGINYLIYMHISMIFIMLGFIFLYIKSGSLEFNSFKAILDANSIFVNSVFLCLFTGFGIKAGFVPFHNWLPKAHPAAPCHVSGIMSGVMIKTGIYGILRVLSLMSIPSISISYFVLIISVISALYGVLYAIAQHDLKKLLAYSSIENIGIIGIGIGVGMLGLAYHNNLVAMLGFAGGILHILNHSIFKELLFMGAGAVYKKTHLKNIEKLGGFIKTMPVTAGLFLIGAVAITGLPPFNGFISEFLIYWGLLKGLEIKNIYVLVILIFSIASLALVGTMALLCFTKAFSIVFLGLPRSEEAESVKTDVSKVMAIPMSILAIFTLLIGIFPQFAIKIVLNPCGAVIPNLFRNRNIYEILKQVQDDGIYNLMQSISLSCFAFIAMILTILGIRWLIFKGKKIDIQNTWSCGYRAVNNRMQYTASSYASPFLSMLKPFFIKHFDIKRPKELFPQKAHFRLDIEDIEEFYIIKPIIKIDERFLSLFQWIQGGNTQQYILYGLIFLICALVGTIIFD